MYLLLNVLLSQCTLELLKYALAVDNDSGTEIGLCRKQSGVNEKRLERIVFIRIRRDGRFRHPAYMRDEPGIKQPAHSGFEFSRALDFCAIFIANLDRLLQISSYFPKDMPRHNGCFSGTFSLSGNTPPFHKVSADRFPDRRFLFSERKKIPTLNIRYKNRIKGNPEESLPLFPPHHTLRLGRWGATHIQDNIAGSSTQL